MYYGSDRQTPDRFGLTEPGPFYWLEVVCPKPSLARLYLGMLKRWQLKPGISTMGNVILVLSLQKWQVKW